MPWSALPEHLNTPEKVELAFPDDSQFGTKTWYGRLYKWFQKKSKPWTAFGPRATEWWARFREVPKNLIVICPPTGSIRIENDDRGEGIVLSDWILPGWYVSRQQKWKRWSIQVNWPLFIAVHRYDKLHYTQVPGVPEDSDGKLWFFYVGFKRDADKVYWLGIYLGRNWK